MASKYRGTCIGGVADGAWIERDDVEIKIDKKKKVAEGEDPVLETTVYKFLLLLGTSNAEIGVWAQNDWSVERVVEHLVRHYNPRTGLIGVPPPNSLPIRH